VTLGDASTNFFHVDTTIKYRKNLITCPKDDVGVSFFYHQQKAQMIWVAFKDRSGVSEFTSIQS